MVKLTAENYRADTLYPRVCDAMNAILAESDIISPLQLFQRLSLLSDSEINDWKNSRIPFLERVLKCNLSKASRILRLMRFRS